MITMAPAIAMAAPAMSGMLGRCRFTIHSQPSDAAM
jgi:hypothetical protein